MTTIRYLWPLCKATAVKQPDGRSRFRPPICSHKPIFMPEFETMHNMANLISGQLRAGRRKTWCSADPGAEQRMCRCKPLKPHELPTCPATFNSRVDQLDQHSKHDSKYLEKKRDAKIRKIADHLHKVKSVKFHRLFSQMAN